MSDEVTYTKEELAKRNITLYAVGFIKDSHVVEMQMVHEKDKKQAGQYLYNKHLAYLTPEHLAWCDNQEDKSVMWIQKTGDMLFECKVDPEEEYDDKVGLNKIITMVKWRNELSESIKSHCYNLGHKYYEREGEAQ